MRLMDFIKCLISMELNFKCEKQRTQFISQGMTNSGIKKTLDYFYGVKNGDKTKA